MIVCICKAVSDKVIVRAVEAGATSVEDVKCSTGACTQCQTCYTEIDRIVKAELVSTVKQEPSKFKFRVRIPDSAPV